MSTSPNSLRFQLDVVDEWPPVGIEAIPCLRIGRRYRILEPPLFVKRMSVGDEVSVKLGKDGVVISWRLVKQSSHTTIWLLRLRETDEIKRILGKLNALGCHTVDLEALGAFSIDVPGRMSIEEVDAVLSELDSEKVAVVFPSFRHSESSPE